MKLVRIPTSNVNEVWSLVKQDIQNALTYSGDYTDSQFVFDCLKNNKMQMWIIWDKSKSKTLEKYYGVVVTEVIQRKLKKSCQIFIMTGRHRQKWTGLIQVLEDFALEQNCDLMELNARVGWQKVLQNYDYKRTHVVLEKQLIKKENN
tara:strand:+ start:602 stop:1045 length:444 start_codon:yes stop_codon:yes gene_type:complete